MARTVQTRISVDSLEILREMAERTQQPMTTVLDKAVEGYRRQQILAETNRAYAALRSIPDAWKEELEEREVWEQTLSDGLEEE